MTKIKCGITMGDPSGIGAEVVLKALGSHKVSRLADFTVIGDRGVVEKCQVSMYPCLPAGRKCQDIKIIDIQNVAQKGFAFGKVKPEYGKAAMEYLQKGLELIKAGRIDCLVTAPVNKEAVNLAGYLFKGQTDYIAATVQVKDVVMMLFNKRLKVALVTRHIPLQNVSRSLSTMNIFKVISITAASLESFFGIKRPRLYVCGLNPHASDNGIIGNEEKKFIIPAIAAAKKKGIMTEGPFPADTIFMKARDNKYDCVVCMYHDQGLIPLKLTGFQDTVNITLGLPFVRTSAGHGSAFDIAGKNRADPSSMISAIKAAVLCTKNLKKA